MPRSGLDTAQAATPRSYRWARTPFQPALSANAPCTSSTVGLEELSGVVVMCTLRSRWPRASSRGREPAPCLDGSPHSIGQSTAPDGESHPGTGSAAAGGGERGVDGGDRGGSFADCSGDTLHRAAPDVPGREDAGDAGLVRERPASQQVPRDVELI